MTEAARPGILLVDDDENIVSALSRIVRRTRRPVHTATDAATAAALLGGHEIGVIVCEPHAPGLAAFLIDAREGCPNTVRVILTGYPDFSGVVRAVNEAHPFKVLTKPWLDDELLAVTELAFELYALNGRRDRLLDDYAAIRVEAERLHAARTLDALAEALLPGISPEAIDALPVGAILVHEAHVAQANPAAHDVLARYALAAPAPGTPLNELPVALALLLSSALATPHRQRDHYAFADGRRLDYVTAATAGGTLVLFAPGG